jgi:hypothetical protein
LGAQPWTPLNFVLAAIVAGIGAVQIATIAATPLPGAEAGGNLYERTQDGKQFKASYDPTKRGFITKPTVITGENGDEYVIPSDGITNPSLRPLIRMIESARLNGNLATVNFDGIVNKQSGALSSYSSRDNSIGESKSAGTTKIIYQTDPAVSSLLTENTLLMKLIHEQFKKPIPAQVTLYGKTGLYKSIDEDNTLKSNGSI